MLYESKDDCGARNTYLTVLAGSAVATLFVTVVLYSIYAGLEMLSRIMDVAEEQVYLQKSRRDQT